MEAWAGGASWPQLVAGTSLDAGDIFRLLKRTVELLRQATWCSLQWVYLVHSLTMVMP